jgi:transposase
MLIGVDYHPSFQQIACLVEETGEYSERRLNHSDGEADRFYRELQQRGVHVRVGMEATGYSRWFERLLAELGFEVWIGDPAEIQAKRVKKQKTDRQDAQLLLKLLVEAAQAAARNNPHWRRRYLRLAMRWHRSIAKVAMGRRLAVRLYWMWRNGCAYSPSMEFGSYAGQLGTGHG